MRWEELKVKPPSRRHPIPLLLPFFLTPGTMWMAPLRKSSPSIRRVLIAPSLFNKSDGSSRPLRYYGGSSYDEDKGPDSLLKMLVRWLSSGVLIVGPSLGFCYCSSSDATPLFSFADCSNVAASATQDHGLRHSDSPDSIPVKKPKYLFGDAYRKEVYFKYEKRMRMRSPPEKVFEYFASFRAPNGEVFMTPADLMRAVVPVFPPSESDYVRYGVSEGRGFLATYVTPLHNFSCFLILIMMDLYLFPSTYFWSHYSAFQSRASLWRLKCLILTIMGRHLVHP
ncbi:Calcium uptake protein, mitochondrial [Vitis vinifera]|uniref:Calcium uptake protein, mitochondrial n=1 Tax=Vitis vinifera TaxID=29760 RepID=A0A438E7Q4_VITVI|nr:Calcium uptake protein, mitochondrial [Vitis vinifera]